MPSQLPASLFDAVADEMRQPDFTFCQSIFLQDSRLWTLRYRLDLRNYHDHRTGRASSFHMSFRCTANSVTLAQPTDHWGGELLYRIMFRMMWWSNKFSLPPPPPPQKERTNKQKQRYNYSCFVLIIPCLDRNGFPLCSMADWNRGVKEYVE